MAVVVVATAALCTRAGDAGTARNAAAAPSWGTTALAVPDVRDTPTGSALWMTPDDRFGAALVAPVPGDVTEQDRRVGAVGDSIMLAAAPRLTTTAGWEVTVDAQVGRQFAAGIPKLAAFADAGMPVLVLHLGTNGPVTDAMFDRAMAATAGAGRVIVLTVQLPDRPRYAYETPTNDVLRRGAARHGAVLVDWHDATEGRADLLQADGIHLTSAGAELYASLVAAAL